MIVIILALCAFGTPLSQAISTANEWQTIYASKYQSHPAHRLYAPLVSVTQAEDKLDTFLCFGGGRFEMHEASNSVLFHA